MWENLSPVSWSSRIRPPKTTYVLCITARNTSQKISDNVKHERFDVSCHRKKHRFGWRNFNDENGRFHNVPLLWKREDQRSPSIVQWEKKIFADQHCLRSSWIKTNKTFRNKHCHEYTRLSRFKSWLLLIWLLSRFNEGNLTERERI